MKLAKRIITIRKDPSNKTTEIKSAMDICRAAEAEAKSACTSRNLIGPHRVIGAAAVRMESGMGSPRMGTLKVR